MVNFPRPTARTEPAARSVWQAKSTGDIRVRLRVARAPRRQAAGYADAPRATSRRGRTCEAGAAIGTARRPTKAGAGACDRGGEIGSRLSSGDAGSAAHWQRRQQRLAAAAERRAARPQPQAEAASRRSAAHARTATEPRRVTGRSAPRRHSCCAIATARLGTARCLQAVPFAVSRRAGTACLRGCCRGRGALAAGGAALFRARSARRAMVRTAARCGARRRPACRFWNPRHCASARCACLCHVPPCAARRRRPR